MMLLMTMITMMMVTATKTRAADEDKEDPGNCERMIVTTSPINVS